MPVPMLKALAKQTRTPLSKVEKNWEKAKELAKKQGFKENDKRFYMYTVGILKKMLGIKLSKSESLLLLIEDELPTSSGGGTAPLSNMGEIPDTGVKSKGKIEVIKPDPTANKHKKTVKSKVNKKKEKDKKVSDDDKCSLARQISTRFRL